MFSFNTGMNITASSNIPLMGGMGDMSLQLNQYSSHFAASGTNSIGAAKSNQLHNQASLDFGSTHCPISQAYLHRNEHSHVSVTGHCSTHQQNHLLSYGSNISRLTGPHQHTPNSHTGLHGNSPLFSDLLSQGRNTNSVSYMPHHTSDMLVCGATRSECPVYSDPYAHSLGSHMPFQTSSDLS